MRIGRDSIAEVRMRPSSELIMKEITNKTFSIKVSNQDEKITY
jgi:hypothetical protein